jgi:hypothetical protein
MAPPKVLVLCGGTTGHDYRGAARFCGWSGRRADGPKVQAPCPKCGAKPDVFRRGPAPDAR